MNIKTDAVDEMFSDFNIKTETSEDIKNKLDESSVQIKTGKDVNKLKKPIIVSKDYREHAVRMCIVPKEYKNAEFKEERIRENIKEQYQSTRVNLTYNLEEYINLCVNILNTIRAGKLPNKSYLIGAPNGYGKASFVNECLMTMVQHGMKTVPFISLWELSKIREIEERRSLQPFIEQIKYGENNTQQTYSYLLPNKHTPNILAKEPNDETAIELHKMYSYVEYLNCDCLFVSFTDVISKVIESHALYQLLAIRGMKALPTIALMSTSLEPYTGDKMLKEHVWDEIKTYNKEKDIYDRVYHVSCYHFKNTSKLNTKGIVFDEETGIVS